MNIYKNQIRFDLKNFIYLIRINIIIFFLIFKKVDKNLIFINIKKNYFISTF